MSLRRQSAVMVPVARRTTMLFVKAQASAIAAINQGHAAQAMNIVQQMSVNQEHAWMEISVLMVPVVSPFTYSLTMGKLTLSCRP